MSSFDFAPRLNVCSFRLRERRLECGVVLTLCTIEFLRMLLGAT